MKQMLTILFLRFVASNAAAEKSSPWLLMENQHHVSIENTKGDLISVLYGQSARVEDVTKVPKVAADETPSLLQSRLQVEEVVDETGSIQQEQQEQDETPALSHPGCMGLFAACAQNGDKADTWFATAAGTIKCCQSVPEYAEAKICPSLLKVAFADRNSVCDTLGDLYQTHIDHVHKPPSLLQTVTDIQANWMDSQVSELRWHVEPLSKALQASHSVLIAETTSGSYRLDKVDGYDVVLVKGGQSSGKVLISAGGTSLNAGTSIMSLIQGFPAGGNKKWNFAINNCHQTVETAFKHVSNVPAPVVPHRAWQEQVGLMLPQTAHDLFRHYGQGSEDDQVER